MAREDRQAVLPEDYRGFRQWGTPRKISTRRLWAVRLVLSPILLLTVFYAIVPVAAGEPAYSIVVFAAGLFGFSLWYFVGLRILSQPAPELPDEWDLTKPTALSEIGPAEARQLKSAGYESAEAIALAEYDELVEQTPFDADQVEHIHTEAREQLGDPETALARLRGG